MDERVGVWWSILKTKNDGFLCFWSYIRSVMSGTTQPNISSKWIGDLVTVKFIFIKPINLRTNSGSILILNNLVWLGSVPSYLLNHSVKKIRNLTVGSIILIFDRHRVAGSTKWWNRRTGDGKVAFRELLTLFHRHLRVNIGAILGILWISYLVLLDQSKGQ